LKTQVLLTKAGCKCFALPFDESLEILIKELKEEQ